MQSDKILDNFFRGYADSEEELTHQVASDRLNKKLESVSTGSHLLNDILGSGGYPLGRIIQLYGPPSSGKSLLSMLGMKEAQKKDPYAKQLYLDAEGTFSTSWAEQLGIDVSRVIIVDGDLAANGRRCFEMLLGVPKADAKHILVGKSKEGLLDKIVNKEVNINLIVLDSLGAIIPPLEDTSAVGKSNMALLARFLTTTFKKLSLEVSKANIPFIVINHKRDNMDPYGSDHTFSGGNSYAHFLSCNIYFEAVMRKDAMILDNKENKIGHLIRATVEKSKFSPFPKKCEFKVRFDTGIIDQHEEIAQLAIDYDVVARPTNVSYEYNEQKWVGAAKFNDALKENPSLQTELLQKVAEAKENKRAKKIVSQSSPTTETLVIDESESEEKTTSGKRGRPAKNS